MGPRGAYSGEVSLTSGLQAMKDPDSSERDERFAETLSEAVNALQAAGLLATLQRAHAGDQGDAVKLQAAIERATHALRRLLDHRDRSIVR